MTETRGKKLTPQQKEQVARKLMSRDLPRAVSGITVSRIPVTIRDGHISIGKANAPRP
ncbi:MAG: hypothetical protein AMXMBFR80_07110 [Dehalococcoidia bacterium]|jgi:hypothetical protein